MAMPTRKDVARRAGVSEATVSYTLSGKRTISAATQARVRRAMADLGYKPHMLAKALAGGGSPIIALLFPVEERGISNADLEYVLGAASAARELGFHLLLWPGEDRDVDDVTGLHQSGLVGGVILMEVRLDDERVTLLHDAHVPLVLIGRTATDQGDVPFADRDFAGAAALAVDHLAGLGHRRLGFLSGPARLISAGYGAPSRAEQGFLAACERHDFTGRIVPCETTIEAGRDLGIALASDPDRPTALVCLNVEATFGLTQAQSQGGLTVPDDLSLVSLGTPESWADSVVPALTTVAAPAREMGRSAVRQLIARITDSGEEADEQQLWLGTLTPRGSSAPPRR